MNSFLDAIAKILTDNEIGALSELKAAKFEDIVFDPKCTGGMLFFTFCVPLALSLLQVGARALSALPFEGCERRRKPERMPR